MGVVTISKTTTDSNNKQNGTLNFSGKYHAFSDKRWVGTSSSTGIADQEYSDGWGTGTDPNPDDNSTGRHIFKGDTLTEWAYQVQASSGSVDGCEIAVVFRDYDWNSTVIYKKTLPNITTDKSDSMTFEELPSVFEAPENGQIFVSIRPIGSFLLLNHIYAAIDIR